MTKSKVYKTFCLFKQQKNKIQKINIENIAVRNFFYDGNIAHQPIETYLSHVESDFSKTYYKIIKEASIENLSERENEILIYLTYIQYMRTEYMRTKSMQIFNDALKEERKSYLKTHTVDEWNRYYNFGTTKHPIRMQKLLLVVNDKYLKYWSDKKDKSTIDVIKIMLNLKENILATFLQNDKVLLEIMEPKLEFYTSDHPILFYSNQSIKDDEGLSFVNIHDSKTILYYPLTPKLCLKYYNKAFYGNYDKKYSNKKQNYTNTILKKLI